MSTARFEDHMSDSDAVMWNIEKDPTLRSTITSVMLLERAPDWGRLVERHERLGCFVPRLRQRVVSPPMRLGTPRWVVDADYDPSYHLRRVAAPPPGDLGAVMDLARAWAMAGFDRARPLWEATVIEGLEGGRAAFVQKVHHSVTDGVGGVEMALRLVDTGPEPTDHEPAPDPLPVGDSGSMAVLREALGTRSRRLAGIAGRLPGETTRVASALLTRPRESIEQTGRLLGSAAKLLAPYNETMSPVMRERSTRWDFRTFDVPLAALKAAGKSEGGTINHAFVAAAAGGLRRYHEKHGAAVEQLRMTMPVNIRTSDQSGSAGNQFSPVRFPIPVGEADPAARIRLLHRVVDAWRAEPAVAATASIAVVLNQLPTTLLTALFGGLLKKVDFVTSNVPGMPFPVWLAGAPVEHWYALGPTSGSALNITLLSYDRTCGIGITSDDRAVPDPDVMAECVEAGFSEVLALAGA